MKSLGTEHSLRLPGALPDAVWGPGHHTGAFSGGRKCVSGNSPRFRKFPKGEPANMKNITHQPVGGKVLPNILGAGKKT